MSNFETVKKYILYDLPLLLFTKNEFTIQCNAILNYKYNATKCILSTTKSTLDMYIQVLKPVNRIETH